MKYIKTMAVAASLACTAASSQAALTLDFTSTPGSMINFLAGGGFNFSPSSDNIQITGGGTGTAFLDQGAIGGSFQINSPIMINGSVESASVTSTLGSLTISDGHGFDLTAMLNWQSITQDGTGSTLNISGLLNLTDIAYGGGQTDLQTLAGTGSGSATLGIVFNPAVPLTTLVDGGLQTSFTGALSPAAVPETTTVVAGLLLLLPFGVSTLRVLRRGKSEAATV